MEQAKDNLDLRPLTVCHGRKLVAKSELLAEQLDQLKPPLALLQPLEEGPDQEAVSRMLENLAAHSQIQIEEMQVINSKLDALLDILRLSEL